MHMATRRTEGRRAYGLRPNIEAEFGERVRVLREALGRSQEAVASRMRELGHEWHQTTLSRVEKGQRGISLDESYCLAAVLGQHLRDFLEEAPGELQRAVDVAQARFFEAHEILALVSTRVAEAEKALATAHDAVDVAAKKPARRKRVPPTGGDS
jgi:transcriptional regulator with XRE-family HTH domain